MFLLSFGLLSSSYCGIKLHFYEGATGTALSFIIFGVIWLFYPYLFYGYILWISKCIAAARERIPGSIDNYVTGVSECSRQRGNLKDDGYI
ncbi:hypothetical protein [Photorhabdus bodei]|uniref:Uncharacterized protein n=1 Tax=Photorhabdus bodei TaxID=2029681 RepID=A0AAW6BE46_9GAMM|nr:hypothetical protein [Photorhabdus bodei]MDB6370900.1 hypothetical protein [Photorhabdus bodei]